MAALADTIVTTDARESLAAAAVRVLDALEGGAETRGRGRRRRWRARVSRALGELEREAADAGLQALARVTRCIAAYLGSGDSAGLRARSVEPWVGALMAVCAGGGDDSRADLLLDAPRQWPQFGDGRASELEAGRTSLADDLRRLAGGGPVADPTVEATAEALALMTESTGALIADLEGLDGDPRAALAHVVEQMPGFGLACRHIGLGALEPVFAATARGLRDSLREADDASLPLSWLDWAANWNAWFESPDTARLARALAPHAESGWVGASTLDGVRRRLSQLRVVDSAQTAPDEDGPADPWPRGLAADADPEVFDELRLELPAAMSAFEAAVTAMGRAEEGAAAEARRIAHTIKGAATTVGLNGIATIAHWLEDLLEDGRQADPTLFADGVDVLAEMIESPEAAQPVSALSREAIIRMARARGAVLVPEPGVDGKPAGTADDMVDPPASPGAQADVDVDVDVQAVDDGPPDEGDASAGAESRAVPATLSAAVAPAIGGDALERIGEALAILAQVQEATDGLRMLHRSMRGNDERMQTLAGELDRLSIAAAQEGDTASDPSIDAAAAAADVNDRERFDPLVFERRASLPSVARRIAETAADNRQMDRSLAEQLDALQARLERLERLHNGLREAALRARMVPASRLSARLRRVCRQACRLEDREAEVVFEGEHTQVDQTTLHALAEPLAHLMRNAVAHGIEPPAARVSAGKPPQGRVLVGFASAGGWLSVTVQDDGAGIDLAAVERRARALGLLAEDLPLDRAAAEQLVLAPGFSTRARASQISGRGIGLDVVNQAVRALRGSLQVRSRRNAGMSVQIDIPLELMLRQVFVLRSRSHVLALSTRGVRAIQADVEAVEWGSEGGRYAAGDRVLDALSLETVLGLPDGLLREGQARPPMLMRIEVPGGRECMLVVPDPGPARPAMIRELAAYMPRLPGIDGAAVLGDGAIAPVIDLPEAVSTTNAAAVDARALPQPAGTLPVCMVVDDSVSVRQATTRFLADLGFATESAENGAQALERLHRQRPDLLVLDLEMPGMDGLELTRAVRAMPGMQGLPIIMITSRASSRVRALALEAGANHFLAKPFSEDELAALVVGILR